MNKKSHTDVTPLPEFMTKGGPGDKSSGGNVNTDSWFVDLTRTHDKDGRKRNEWRLIPDVLDKGTIAQQAKDQELFFCDIPFTQLYMEIDGNYQPCCFGKPDGKSNILNTTMKEWMTGDAMNGIRNDMLDPNVGRKGEYVKKHCTRCLDDEDRYGKSRRTACMKIHSNDASFWSKVNRAVQMYEASGFFDFDERIIEVQLKVYGSECNLDCYMCTHANSTIRQKVAFEGVWNDAIFGKLDQTAKDFYKWVTRDKTDILKEPDVEQDKDGVWTIPIHTETFPISNTKSMVEQTMQMSKYIRSIKVIGGEPLIMKKHYELLDKLIESGDAEHIYLKYQTNLTETKAGKHNIFNYIPKFRRVSMVASVDGIGKTIEYMRRRCSWDKIVDNARISNSYSNVDVDFNGLVSFLSVMRFYEVIDWCLDEGKDMIDQINWAMLETPKHMRVNMLPEKLKKELLPKYEGWPDIQEALRLPAEKDVDLQELFDYLLDADKYYEGTRWQMHLFDVFPELKEYYVKPEDREFIFKSDDWLLSSKNPYLSEVVIDKLGEDYA
jgi:hypothetical protein